MTSIEQTVPEKGLIKGTNWWGAFVIGLAGTILVSGRVGESPGFGLKHGTLLLAHAPAELLATFQDCGEHALLFLTLLEKHFQREGGPFHDFVPLATRVRRYCGDLATGGKGEILLGL